VFPETTVTDGEFGI